MNKTVSAYAKGWMGEDRACAYLQDRGMVLLERRYHSPYGEIDLIMQDRNMLVFVEVKTRASGEPGAGLVAITPAKRRKLVQTALCYIAQHTPDAPMRFDAVEISKSGVLHIPNAFEA